MPPAAVGLICLLGFVLAQGLRDALFGNVFQSVSFLVVACLAFGLSTALFGVWVLLRQPDALGVVIRNPGAALWLNLTTAVAWLALFYGLRSLEPAVAATLYNGIGPLAALTFARGPPECARPGRAETACYVAMALSLVALICVTAAGQSGLAVARAETALALAAAAGGVAIAVAHLIARRLAGTIETWAGEPRLRPEAAALPFLALSAFALVVLPSLLLQLGVARASPLAVNVMRALGPVAVFVVQQFDNRLAFSTATLACILVFSGSAIVASGVRARAELG